MSRKKRTRRANACLLFTGISLALLSAIGAYRVFWREIPVCFVVDALGARVPRQPVEPLRVADADVPLGTGTICFYAQQQLAEWRVDESFNYAYDNELYDFALHGPLRAANDSVAPVLRQLGLRRRTPLTALRGTVSLPTDDISRLVRSSDRYYVAFHALSLDNRGTVEVGRGILDRRAKIK